MRDSSKTLILIELYALGVIENFLSVSKFQLSSNYLKGIYQEAQPFPISWKLMCLRPDGIHVSTPPTHEEIRSLEQLLISYSFFRKAVI